MAKERRLLVISPQQTVWLPIVRGFCDTGWAAENVNNLAAGMRLIDAHPMAYDLVVMDEDHGCENATFRDVLSGLREIRCLNEKCKVFFLVNSRQNTTADIKVLKGLVHGIGAKKNAFAQIFGWSVKYFRYIVQ